MEIIKETKNNGVLTIKEIDYYTAKNMIVKNHYSKKWNSSFGKINIGIFKDNELKGCCVFGNLMNPNSWASITDLGKDKVMELNRMWVSDDLNKNAETVLLSASFRIIQHKFPNIYFIQSFADGRLGCGTVYKAANFKYYGFSKSLFFRHKDTGETFHKVPLENTKRPYGFLVKNSYLLDDKLTPFYVKTYRYIYSLNKKYKPILQEQEYPSYEKGEVETEYTPADTALARLYVMYLNIGANTYAQKALNLIKSTNKEALINNALGESAIKDFLNKKDFYRDKLKVLLTFKSNNDIIEV